ncbi:MAG: site-2 protease family protein [Bdellovibrionaceae bacterium]|nr:site-2 protease family protein [Pseudobdellovibrionaceae bacterium]
MNHFNLVEVGAKVAVFFVPFLFALCFHEFAHGWVARRKGDRTAEIMGRLTLNPFAHLDWFGTVILPIMAIAFQWPLFGWAKPVPVNSRNLENPKKDMFWIALAGPLSNVILAVVGAVALGLVHPFLSESLRDPVSNMLVGFIWINLLLAIFNMIPMHPLDGGKVLARFLPESANRKMEENQSTMNMILIGVFLMGGFRYLAYPVGFLRDILIGVAETVARLIS